MDTNSVQRNIMVDTQIKARGIRDAKVLDAMRKVERHLFVPEGFVYAVTDRLWADHLTAVYRRVYDRSLAS